MCEMPDNSCNPATQVKVSVKSEVARAFKASCRTNDTSMTTVLSDFMIQYSKVAVQKGGYAPNLSSRRQRRAAVYTIIHQLVRIKDNEELYRDNIPLNLQGGNAFDIAEQTLSTLDEVLDLLASVY